MNEQQITKLIERYFAAETTLEEEKELRRLLADPSTAHIPMADEARAVIGWARMNATPRRRILPTAFLKIMSAAAMLGIATGVGLNLMLPADRPEGTARRAARHDHRSASICRRCSGQGTPGQRHI